MSLSKSQSLRMAAVLGYQSPKLEIIGHLLKVQLGRESATQEKVWLVKLTKDCQCILSQMSTLYLELTEKQSFISLQKAVEEEGQKQKKREAEIELEYRAQTVQWQLEELQLKMDKLKDMDCYCKDLMTQHEEQLSKIVNKKRTAELQLQLRQKETCQAENQLEDQLEDQLQLLQKQLKDQKRFHEESKKFLQNQQKELQQLLDEWKRRTKQMLHEKEEQLNSVCCKKTQTFDRLMEMKKQFKEMEQVVMEDREEQKKLRQKQAEVRAATKLQAWWRGCMVRRGLGCFKKEENKKGKKKKEGKKKNKK